MGNSNLERLLRLAFPNKHMGRTVRNLYMTESFHTLKSIIAKEIESCKISIEAHEYSSPDHDETQRLIKRLDNLEMLEVEISYLINSRPEEEEFTD